MRNIFILLLLVIASSCVKKEIEKADLYAGVPKSSVIVVQTEDLLKLQTEILESQIYLDSDSLKFIEDLQLDLENLAEVFSKDTLDQFLSKRKAIISISLSGASKYDLLFITADGKFSSYFKKRLASTYSENTREYSGASIVNYSDEKGELFSMGVYKGLFLFSGNSALVEEAVRQMNGEFNFKDDENFQRLSESANPKDLANIYIQPNEAPNWFKTFLPKAKLNFLSRIGGWAELDLQVYNRELLLSGVVLAGENNGLISSFKGVDAQRTSADEIIPRSAGLWISYTFENAEHYHRNYVSNLKAKGTINKYQQLLNSSGVDDPKPKLLNWVDTEMGLVYTGVAGDVQNKIAYFKARSSEKAEEGLMSISDSSYIEGYRGYILKKLGPQNLLPRFYGNLFDGFNNPYYFVAGKYVWFAENEAVLKAYINDLITGKPFNTDESYKNFNSKIPSKSHVKVLASNPALMDLLPPILKRKEVKSMEKAKDGLGNLKWAAFQLDVKNDLAYTNFLILNEPKTEDEVSRQWNTVLEAPASSAPQFVLNHNNRKYDILVQDKNHMLYQVDRNGKILWKKQLDGKMMGACRQVDLYKNNKLQLAFNTTTSIYMVDRLGRDVENFPVKLEAEASAAMGVFNYDNARNYRFIIPVGNTLLNYGKDGKKVRGWKFGKADGNLISRPQLFTIGGKDVIICLSDQGTLYTLNRRGESRFEAITELKGVQAPFYLRQGEDLKTSELIANNEDGELAVINFNGNSDEIFLDEDNPAEHFLYFEGKYILSNGTRLMVKDEDLPWSADLEEDISTAPKAMIFNKEFYVAVWCEDAEEVSLYNKRGELIKGFPVFGQAPFDMGSLKQNGVINIVTSTADGTLICYEVN